VLAAPARRRTGPTTFGSPGRHAFAIKLDYSHQVY
jgi:hypothetical protein